MMAVDSTTDKPRPREAHKLQDITNKPQLRKPKHDAMADNRSRLQGQRDVLRVDLPPVKPGHDVIHITSHKLEPLQLSSQKLQTPPSMSHQLPETPQSPAQRLLRRKQEADSRPPEVYLLDLDEVKVHKVKRIFKIGQKTQDDLPRRCRSEERSRRRTWHPTDTDRSTRSDGDVVTGRATLALEDFSSPSTPQERQSRPRQRRSAFMESIHSFFSSRKHTSSPSKHNNKQTPLSSTGGPREEADDVSKHHVIRADDVSKHHVIRADDVSKHHVIRADDASKHHVVRADDVNMHHLIRADDVSQHHVVRAQGGHLQVQLRHERVRHLAEDSPVTSPPQQGQRSREASASPNNSRREILRAPVSSKPSPKSSPPQAYDKNHVIYGMGEMTFQRFTKYLTVYDDQPESRV